MIFSEGTGQDGGARPEQRISNIYKLYCVCRSGPDSAIDPAQQVAFYDPSLGTDIGATELTSPVRFAQKLLSSMTGRGITTNIADLLCVHHQLVPAGRPSLSPGFQPRRVHGRLPRCSAVFRQRRCTGRSRFTVMPSQTLPRRRSEPSLSMRQAIRGRIPGRTQRTGRFRADYSCFYGESDTGRSNAAPHFIGVFESVAALGAHGPVRLAIKAALAILLINGSIAVAFVLTTLYWLGRSAVVEALDWYYGSLHDRPAFLPVFLRLTLVSMAVIGVTTRFKYKASVTKTIRDFPNKGDLERRELRPST